MPGRRGDCTTGHWGAWQEAAAPPVLNLRRNGGLNGNELIRSSAMWRLWPLPAGLIPAVTGCLLYPEYTSRQSPTESLPAPEIQFSTVEAAFSDEAARSPQTHWKI